MGRGRGGSKTPQRVVELLESAIKTRGQSTVESETGLSHSMISRYKRGIGEPSQATLEKLAEYFGVSVAYLRGDPALRGMDKFWSAIGGIAYVAEALKNEYGNDENITILAEMIDEDLIKMIEFIGAASDQMESMVDLITSTRTRIEKRLDLLKSKLKAAESSQHEAQ